ncbi:MAG TPA: fumarylacetoacetate hydrolase family protein [Xanthobacteraceae bacterium]
MATAIDEFAAARGRGEYFPQAWADRLSLDDAYRIQLALLARCGARRVGWKVGLTSTAIQQQFQVHEPVFGCLPAEGRLESGHAFRANELIAPGFENELCLMMGTDLAPGATREEVAAAVARVHPAFEIIETRGDLTRQLALALADNAQQRAFVLGPPVSRADLPELDKVTISVRINGTEVAAADGSAVLGHPYNSVVWLAGKLAQFGERVKAGDYIMTGSFPRQFPLNTGGRIEADFTSIGAVRASVG